MYSSFGSTMCSIVTPPGNINFLHFLPQRIFGHATLPQYNVSSTILVSQYFKFVSKYHQLDRHIPYPRVHMIPSFRSNKFGAMCT